jgi:hypothetical protein
MKILNAIKKIIIFPKDELVKTIGSMSAEDKEKLKNFAEEALNLIATAAVNSAAQKVSEKI